MSGSAAFFQVALGLIPALLFGGALLERGSDRKTRVRPLEAALVLLLLVSGVVAQIIAIRGAIDPTSVSRLEQRFLVLVVTVGTLAIAGWTAGPWLNDLPRRSVVKDVALFSAILACVVAQLAITASLDRSAARRALDSAVEDLDERRATESRSRTQLASARMTVRATTDEISAAVRPAAVPRLRTAVAVYLDIADSAEPSDDDLRGRPSELTRAFRRTHDELEQAQGRLLGALDRVNAAVDEVDLMDEITDRLDEAVSDHMVAHANRLAASRRYEEACDEAARFDLCTRTRSR